MKYGIDSQHGRRDFAVIIEPAEGGPAPQETGDGYVGLRHMQTFALLLGNPNPVQADAEVRVNGKSVGVFRLRMWGEMRLERPENDPSRFTAIVTRTREAWAAGLAAGDEQNGLIEVTFKPERPQPPVVRPSWSNSIRREGVYYGDPQASLDEPQYRSARGMSASGMPTKEMGVGLSGHSSQTFTRVAALDYDETGIVKISLRICELAGSPVSTQSVHPIREEPVGNLTPRPVR